MEEEGHVVGSTYGAAQGCPSLRWRCRATAKGFSSNTGVPCLTMGECTSLAEAYCFKTCRNSQSLNDWLCRFYLSVEDRSEIFCLAC